MALPTMNGFWSSRKNVYEQAIVHHRNREDDFRSQWKNTSNYFKTSNVRAAKQQAWSSTEAFQNKWFVSFSYFSCFIFYIFQNICNL